MKHEAVRNKHSLVERVLIYNLKNIFLQHSETGRSWPIDDQNGGQRRASESYKARHQRHGAIWCEIVKASAGRLATFISVSFFVKQIQANQ